MKILVLALAAALLSGCGTYQRSRHGTASWESEQRQICSSVGWPEGYGYDPEYGCVLSARRTQ